MSYNYKGAVLKELQATLYQLHYIHNGQRPIIHHSHSAPMKICKRKFFVTQHFDLPRQIGRTESEVK